MLRLLLLYSALSLVLSFPSREFNIHNNDGVVRMKQIRTEVENVYRDVNYVHESNPGNQADLERLNLGECTICAGAVTLIRHWLHKGKTYEEISRNVVSWCSTFHIESREVCNGIIYMFKDEVLEVLSNVTLGSYEICEVLTKKNCSGHEIPFFQWSINIPEKKINHNNKNIPKTSGPPLRVLHLTDIHVDFNYLPGSKVKCKEPLCCRSGQPTRGDPGAGFWGSLGSCDLPTWTVENLFEHLSKEKFDYILWTGDLLSHNVWNQTKEEQFQSLHYLAGLFIRYFPNIPVYPALGNHEGVPVNSFPPHFIKVKDSMEWLYRELSKTWQHWLPDDVEATIMRGGFYSTLVAPNFRLISLNMNYCNNFNWWLLLSSTDPESELEWLVTELENAEQKGEKVQIIGHIPPGIPDCLKTWSWNYYRIINRYKDIIGGQFFGHLHLDTLHLFYDTGYHPVDEPIREPIAVAYIAPSVTTYQHLNPGYRVYDVEGFHANSLWSVLDHHTYIMNLTLANVKNNTTWIREYSAKEAYGMKSFSPNEWESVLKRMIYDDELFNKFHKFFYKSNPIKPCHSDCKKMMLCSAVSGRSYDDAFCKHLFQEQVNGEKPMVYSDLVEWFKDNQHC